MLLALVILAAAPDAGALATLKLEGAKGGALTIKELQELGTVTLDWTGKPGTHKVTGVRLDRLLPRLGFEVPPKTPTVDPKAKHLELRATIVATAADGYETSFSVAEVQEALGATTALVVWEMDGKPLSATDGPFRLVVTTDKKMTRSLFQLVNLRLVPIPPRG